MSTMQILCAGFHCRTETPTLTNSTPSTWKFGHPLNLLFSRIDSLVMSCSEPVPKRKPPAANRLGMLPSIARACTKISKFAWIWLRSSSVQAEALRTQKSVNRVAVRPRTSNNAQVSLVLSGGARFGGRSCSTCGSAGRFTGPKSAH